MTVLFTNFPVRYHSFCSSILRSDSLAYMAGCTRFVHSFFLSAPKYFYWNLCMLAWTSTKCRWHTHTHEQEKFTIFYSIDESRQNLVNFFPRRNFFSISEKSLSCIVMHNTCNINLFLPLTMERERENEKSAVKKSSFIWFSGNFTTNLITHISTEVVIHWNVHLSCIEHIPRWHRKKLSYAIAFTHLVVKCLDFMVDSANAINSNKMWSTDMESTTATNDMKPHTSGAREDRNPRRKFSPLCFILINEMNELSYIDFAFEL